VTLGEDIKLIVDDLLNNEDIRTSFTVTPITKSNSNYGYDGSTSTSGTATLVYGVPSNNINPRLNFLKMGDMKEGDLRVIMPADTVVNEKSIVTFKTQTYTILEMKPIVFNEITVAIALSLSKTI
jgi:hypothetical protein